MPAHFEIVGADKLAVQLGERAARAVREGEPVVAVGYTANYALYVHENMEIWPPGMRLKGLPRGLGFSREQDTGIVRVPQHVLKSSKVGGKNRGFYWDPQGRAQPKFLEKPLREKREVLIQIVNAALSRGKTMAQALLLAGLYLQRESQLLVPVDTGNLKNSAFTRLEAGAGSSPGGSVGAATGETAGGGE